MSQAHRPMMVAEFLDWEERQELRYEFDGFAPVAMTGGTIAHELIGGNIRGELYDRLRGTRCRVLGPTTKVEARGRVRYPDALVACGPLDQRRTVVPEPVVVFEVISPSTSRTDRVEKLGDYLACPSIQRYVILEQDSAAATQMERRGDYWVARPLTGDVLTLPEIGVELPLAAIYEGLEFPTGDANMGDEAR